MIHSLAKAVPISSKASAEYRVRCSSRLQAEMKKLGLTPVVKRNRNRVNDSCALNALVFGGGEIKGKVVWSLGIGDRLLLREEGGI